MAALKKRNASLGTERAKIGKLQAQLEATAEQLNGRAADLLQAAQMEQVRCIPAFLCINMDTLYENPTM